MEKRKIKKIFTGRNAVDGAGVKLVRVFGYKEAKETDPFLMMDAFDAHNPADYIKGFPWHPHRGIETITYLLKGRIRHGDSLKNEGLIEDGDCQWMTAGSGIIHQEMPEPAGHMLGFQLWLNLPAAHKMCKPAYHGIVAKDVPVVSLPEAEVRVLAGHYNGVAGAMQGEYVPALYLDVSLRPGAHWQLETPSAHTLFLYVLEGELAMEGETAAARQAVLFTNGKTLSVQAAGQSRFVLMCAPPLGEPIAWGGPIVMNTEEDLKEAFRQLDNNTFIQR